MVLGSLRTPGGSTPSAGLAPSCPCPHRPTLQPGRGSTRHVWGGSWQPPRCRGVHRGLAGGTVWPSIGDWVTPPPRVPAMHPDGAARLTRLCACIYLFTGEIPLTGPRRAPAGQKYSRNASNCSSALVGPQASSGRASRPCVPCSPASHGRPGPWWSLSPGCKATVPWCGWVPDLCSVPLEWGCGEARGHRGPWDSYRTRDTLSFCLCLIHGMLGLALLISVWGQHCLSRVWGSQGTLGMSGFWLRAHLHPQGQAETCSGTGWSPHRAQVVTASPRAAGVPGSLPLAPLPLFIGRPQPSRGSFATKSGITVGLPRCVGGLPGWHTSALPALASGQGAVCPQERFAGIVVFMAKPREEQTVSGQQHPVQH